MSTILPTVILKSEGGNCVTCHERCGKFVFHCVRCGFYIHDHYFPTLPQTIKHECHCDPLTLTHSKIKDFLDQDIEQGTEFYCFAWEGLRNFDHPTYYCQECHFVAHVHCVISEIIPYIEAQSKKLCDDKNVEIYSEKTSSHSINYEDEPKEANDYAVKEIRDVVILSDENEVEIS